jgi:hypothetical protein
MGRAYFLDLQLAEMSILDDGKAHRIAILRNPQVAEVDPG